MKLFADSCLMKAHFILKKGEKFIMIKQDTPYTSKCKGDSTIDYSEHELYYNKKEVKVPIHLKVTLTIKEAAEYSNIGINKIDTMLKQPNCPFVLYVGTRKLVKRREFEEFIRREIII